MADHLKSNRQRREEIRASRQKKQLRAAQREEDIKGKAPVNENNLGPNHSVGLPLFVQRGYYIDQSFFCKECGESHVWTATQQKWWYESAKGDMWAVAVLCRPCRCRERERKKVAREASLAGVARKSTAKSAQ